MIPTQYLNKIVRCDAVEGLRALPAASVPLTVTSPPYDKLRVFGGHGWGIETFTAVAGELFRVTTAGGVVVWVVADAIVGGTETCTSARQKLGFREAGFHVHHTMVMHRAGSRWPSQVRYGNSLEYAFILSKGRPRTINLLRDKRNKQWCRLGRVIATKLPGGRGNEGEWRISHEKLDRYRNEGLLRRGKY